MKSLFEEMGGTYRQVGDYFIPNLVLPDDGDYQIGKFGRMRRSYLKEHRKILYTNYVMEGTLFKHLSEIDQACNKRMEIIVSAMAKQENLFIGIKIPTLKKSKLSRRYADKYGIERKKSLDFFLFMLQSFMIELEVIK